jgi:16S rRNA (guanine527-N7)-methyltransferase
LEVIKHYFGDLNTKQTEQFAQLDAVYRSWNEKINVISRKDIDLLYERHVLHSLSIAKVISFKPNTDILDVGTGGGFPGIPLAILFPESKFTLVDSIGKKIKVVNEVSAAIQLKNVTTHHGRVETIQNKKFDFAVSRAVAPLGDLWQWIQGSLKTGHKSEELPNGLICLKGGDLNEEINASGLAKIVQAWEVNKIFPEPSFDEKFVIYVPKLH